MINVVANRYAEALFNLGEEENKTNELYSELREVVALIQSSKELYSVLASPLVTKNEKKELVEKIFNMQISKNLKNFIKLLIDKDRSTALESIEKIYKKLLNEKNNAIEGTVISAIEMSKEDIVKLEEKLSKKYDKNITLVNTVDETILGGILVRLGNEEIDGTVKTRLAKIKDQLSQVIS